MLVCWGIKLRLVKFFSLIFRIFLTYYSAHVSNCVYAAEIWNISTSTSQPVIPIQIQFWGMETWLFVLKEELKTSGHEWGNNFQLKSIVFRHKNYESYIKKIHWREYPSHHFIITNFSEQTETDNGKLW